MKINSYFQFHILHLENKCRLIAYGACHDATMSQHKSYTDANPFFVRIGRDENDFIYTQGFYAGGSSAPDLAGTGFTVTDKYYLNISTSTWQTNTSGARTLSDGIQFGWGNYDNYHVENMRRIVVRTNGD